MVNVIKVYVDSVLNKHQVGGYMNPKEYNNYLEVVSDRYYHEAFKRYQESQEITDDLRPLFSWAGEDSPVTSFTGVFALADDYRHLDSVLFQKVVGVECGDPVVELFPALVVSNDQMTSNMRDPLTKPTLDHPQVAVFSDGLHVLPKSINRIKYKYLRKPVNPFWDYTMVNNVPEFLPAGDTHDGTVLTSGTASRTTDFDFGESAFISLQDMMVEIASKRTRDQFNVQTTKAEL